MLTLSVLMAELGVGSNAGACGVCFAFGGASKAGTLRRDSHTEARYPLGVMRNRNRNLTVITATAASTMDSATYRPLTSLPLTANNPLFEF